VVDETGILVGEAIVILTPGDRARFVESWRGVQARFVDGPAGAVTEADELLGDVMSTRGYRMCHQTVHTLVREINKGHTRITGVRQKEHR
jgi:hypothetical protein